MNQYTSRLSNLYQMNQAQRLKKVADQAGEGFNTKHFEDTGNIAFDRVDAMVENVIGTMNIPLGIATNMVIDDEERLVAMATEESSVIAAVCNAAKQCRSTGGFRTRMSGSLMIAQIQILNIVNPEMARLKILSYHDEIKSICDQVDPVLLQHGGGFHSLEVRTLFDGEAVLVIVHLLVDTRDAMGANAVNTMAEAVAPKLTQWVGGKSNLRILSNLADRRVAYAYATWKLAEIGGEAVRDKMLSAYRFAYHDPYRATTHNKGIMNGISAVVLATGNDTRAVEAGAHAYAARSGQYRALSHWESDSDGNLCASLEVPMAVGLIGGATKIHPTAQQALKLMRIDSADTLARITCSVGLAQNFAAMKALASTGIQKGHMALHAKNIAVTAGASGDEVEMLAKQLIAKSQIRMDVATDLLAQMRQKV